MPDFTIRPLRPEEIPLLDDFLYEAIYLPRDFQGDLPRSIIYTDPQLYASIRDFGSHPDDYALVAEEDGQVVGAVWGGITNEYGHLDNATPSLTISLHKPCRGRGIGTALLSAMLDLLRAKGYRRVSLGVSKENYALRMYKKAGFRILGDGANASEWLMVCDL